MNEEQIKHELAVTEDLKPILAVLKEEDVQAILVLKEELADNKKEVFKLTITNNSDIVQGLLSLSIESDHVYMHLLENA
jgi:hypothetical protein